MKRWGVFLQKTVTAEIRMQVLVKNDILFFK